ncbi:hypothetical protein Spico_0075 [Parasphaerochaeta coccoides DSM 17374]|uniref:Uncharacterized protein n=1 Tax=Parasphaerochaeta coccoides (strain ATCC BAA-1237 / DSM 17374 / SPN1) TaxID=760011 RepID=F4GJ22_PARC1|nr:hypothetical protein Spico_0075 [Parasphaerochaeta coccoides DSM 17374]
MKDDNFFFFPGERCFRQGSVEQGKAKLFQIQHPHIPTFLRGNSGDGRIIHRFNDYCVLLHKGKKKITESALRLGKNNRGTSRPWRPCPGIGSQFSQGERADDARLAQRHGDDSLFASIHVASYQCFPIVPYQGIPNLRSFFIPGMVRIQGNTHRTMPHRFPSASRKRQEAKKTEDATEQKSKLTRKKLHDALNAGTRLSVSTVDKALTWGSSPHLYVILRFGWLVRAGGLVCPRLFVAAKKPLDQ